VTLTFDAVVQDTVTTNDALDGLVVLTYSSSPNNVNGNVGREVTINAVTTIYSALLYSLSAISVTNVSVPLSTLPLPTVTVGEVVTFTVTLRFGEGTSRLSNYTFVLPASTSSNAGTLAVVNSEVVSIGSQLTTGVTVGSAGTHSN